MEDKCANMAKECLGCAHSTQEYHEYPCSECEHNGGEYKMYFPAAEMNAILAKEDKPKIKDSGERRVFETGAVRDVQEGVKGRCDLLPLDVVARLLHNPTFAFINRYKETNDVNFLFDALTSSGVYHDSYTMILEVAKHFEEGAKKYGEYNWQKGIPVHCYIDSAVRHYSKWLRGDTDEPHDRAFCWNVMCAIWTCKHKPELNDYAKKDGE